MESQSQNPEFRDNPEMFHPYMYSYPVGLEVLLSQHMRFGYLLHQEAAKAPTSLLVHIKYELEIVLMKHCHWVRVQNFQNPDLWKFKF